MNNKYLLISIFDIFFFCLIINIYLFNNFTFEDKNIYIYFIIYINIKYKNIYIN